MNEHVLSKREFLHFHKMNLEFSNRWIMATEKVDNFYQNSLWIPVEKLMTMEVFKNSAEYWLENQITSPNVFYRNRNALRGRVSTRCGLIKLMSNKIWCFLLNLLLINPLWTGIQIVIIHFTLYDFSLFKNNHMSLFHLLYSSTSTMECPEISRIQILEISRIQILEVSRFRILEISK